jgi:DNA modification methylase
MGREEAVRLAGSVPRGRLERVPGLSAGGAGSGNLVIQGDNLLALAALAPSLAGRVDLAFLDPPYNAARERWVYPDRVGGWFGSVVGAEGEDPLRHDKWLSMMYPRLVLLRDLLAGSGAVFLTLDYHEAHHARVLLDEVFGPENFLADVAWEKTRTPEDSGSPFLETHTHVISYARDAGAWTPNPEAGKPRTIWSSVEAGDTREARESLARLAGPQAPSLPFSPKPVKLLRRILRVAAGPEALVLDPFAGTGTTAQAVVEQNASDGGARRFVLVEEAQQAQDLIARRLARLPAPPDYDFYVLERDPRGPEPPP